jgi:hypothetical protein
MRAINNDIVQTNNPNSRDRGIFFVTGSGFKNPPIT